jgi:hypothetical protein
VHARELYRNQNGSAHIDDWLAGATTELTKVASHKMKKRNYYFWQEVQHKDSYRQNSTERWQYIPDVYIPPPPHSPVSLKKLHQFREEFTCPACNKCLYQILPTPFQPGSQSFSGQLYSKTIFSSICLVIDFNKILALFINSTCISFCRRFKVIQWKANWLENLGLTCQIGGPRAAKLFRP